MRTLNNTKLITVGGPFFISNWTVPNFFYKMLYNFPIELSSTNSSKIFVNQIFSVKIPYTWEKYQD